MLRHESKHAWVAERPHRAPGRQSGAAAPSTEQASQHASQRQRFTRRHAAIVEVVPDATLVVDSDGRIQLVNRQTELLFGYAREALLGQPVEMLLPEQYRTVHRQHRTAYAAAPHIRPIDANLQLFARRHDGSEFPVAISLAPLHDGDETLVIASIRDVTDVLRLHEAHRETEATNHDLCRLLAVTDTALGFLEVDDLVPELARRVHDAMDVDNAAILLVDEAGRALHVAAVVGLEEAVAAEVRVPVGEGFAGRIAASRAPLVVDDLAHLPVVTPLLRERLRSVLGVPLLRHGDILGVLHVGTVAPRHFTAQEVQLLERVAERVAVALEGRKLFDAERQARHTAQALRVQAELEQARAEAAQTRAEAAQARAQAAEVRAKTSDARLRRLVEAGIMGIAVGEGTVVHEANDTFLRMVGYSREDFEAGRVPWEQQAAGASARDGVVSARAIEELRRRGVCTPYEREFLRPDGSRLPALLGAALLCRTPLEWVCFAIDISDRRRLEVEREEAQASALAAQEVAAQLDQFFAMASHDIRSPLTALNGYVHLARMRAEQLVDAAPEQGAERPDAVTALLRALDRAEEGLASVLRLVALLFDVARARSGTLTLQLAPCNLVALVHDQVVTQRAATPTRRIDLELPEQPVRVVGDAARLEQVLTNYLTNALKYSPDHQPVLVRLEVAAGLAVVSVHDHGPGLPWVEQSRVWELYHRAPGVEVQGSAGAGSGSLGLGLHICKRLMELHPGGRVGLESVVGAGSTFWFRLPVADGTSAPVVVRVASTSDR